MLIESFNKVPPWQVVGMEKFNQLKERNSTLGEQNLNLAFIIVPGFSMCVFTSASDIGFDPLWLSLNQSWGGLSDLNPII